VSADWRPELVATSSGSEFLSAAAKLGERIWRDRVRAQDGSVTWIRPGSPGRGEPVGLRVRVDPYLYDGSAGIALFFAALARVEGGGDHRERSLQAIAPVRRRLAGLVADPEHAARLERVGIGGMVGLGSLIYAFLRIGTLLGETDLVGEARDLLNLLTPDRIARDESCDVLYGGAGAILALLALHEAAPAPALDGRSPLEIARACAQRVIERQLDDPPGAWRTLAGLPPLGGFSHGASGIGHALLRLYQRAGDEDVLWSARRGLAFVDTFYLPERRSWRDARDAERYDASWCSGAAGIVLSRLGAVARSAELAAHVSSGLATLRAAPWTDVDHLCCGNLGRTEALLAAWEMTGDESLKSAAESIAGEALRRARERGDFGWRPGSAAGPFDPTFFTGAAGLGYSFLRLACPAALPCVLLLR
jgi:class II lanthipeptide synthase